MVRCARQQVVEKGAPALSLRELAKKTGTSAAAPHVHFPAGEAEVVAAVAVEGFRDLIRCLEDTPAGSDPWRRAFDMTMRYVRFGVENAHLYRAMFSPLLADPLSRLDDNPEQRGNGTFALLENERIRAFEVIQNMLEEIAAEGRLRESAFEAGLAVAAVAHGIVGEFIDEGLGLRQSRAEPWSSVRQEMARGIVRSLFTGISPE